jgi:hypothetical protein
MGGKWPTDPTPHPTGDHLMKEVPTHIAPQVSFVSYRSLLSLIGLFCLIADEEVPTHIAPQYDYSIDNYIAYNK